MGIADRPWGSKDHKPLRLSKSVANQSIPPQPGRRHEKLALLPSELATVACAVWVAARLYNPGSVTVLFQVGALTLWLLVLLAELSPMPAPVEVCLRFLGLGALVLLGHSACPGLGWESSAAIAIATWAALAVTRRLLKWSAGADPLTRADGWRGAALQAAAAYALQAYVVSAQVGSGDAYHYSLMLSDAVGQLRARVFPLFVGQTPYAFNGNIHTLRTAPLFEYLGGGLDFLTLHTLPIFGLQGLVLLSAAMLGCLGCYAALRRFVPERPWAAAGAAALYVLCPGVLAPLYAGDMIATFLTVPILPWLVLGLAKASDDPRRWAPWIGQAAALAALWWAHPPVAFWASLLVVGAWLLVLVRGGWSSAIRMACAVLAFAVLTGYVFVSVESLQLRVQGATAAQQVANVMQSGAEGWRSSLRPLSDASYLGGIQLGYSLLAFALMGLLALRSRRSSGMLLAAIAAYLVLLFPVPWLTLRLWSWAPHAVLTVTNSWPAQRFYVILAALSAFAGMAGIARIRASRAAAALACVGFAAALAWSAAEAHKLIIRGRSATNRREEAERSHRPDNVTLTRSSYLVFNFFPPYFSHGVMTPFLETRLIDPKTFEVVADGSTTAPGLPAAPVISLEMRGPDATNKLTPLVPLAAGHTSLLRFDFLGHQPQGVLEIIGKDLLRDYFLPSSGMDSSFGTGPTNSRVIAITNDGAAVENLRFLFFSRVPGDRTTETFAKLSVEWLDSAQRAVAVRSLIPFEAVVQSRQTAFLETPKVFVPGYCATLNGHPVMVVKSANGLAAVPVPAGASVVRVEYPGTPMLRYAFWVSACGWLCVAAVLLAGPSAVGANLRPAEQEGPLRQPRDSRKWAAAGLAAIVILSASLWAAHRAGRGPDGPIHLVITLPWAKVGSAEPLVTTGRTGAGDIIYLKILGDGKVSVGHDKWGYGGAISNPIEVDATQPQLVDVEMGSLGTGHGVRVRWNGAEVLSDSLDSYPADAGEKVEIGANRIGGSTCQEQFTGRILESTRGAPPPPVAR